MASGNCPQENFRKAIGALKDSTKVGIARVNSEYKEVDVAIVKATNHDEMLPKQKHIRTIFNSVSASSPRADVAYCIHALAKRLAKTRTWTVALKVLVVIHRGLREVDPTFREELTNYNFSRVHLLNLSHFKDDSSPSAWDYSAWVRTYSLYLEELLECSRRLKYDFQKHHLRSKKLDTPDLLEQLPVLQQLLFRLLACKPHGAARYNFLIQYALSIVANESVALYVTITDGIVSLVDKFFDMQRHDAIRALEIYKKAANQAERLSEFFEICRSLQFGTQQKYIKIEQAPASFLTAMEEYVKEAPQTLMLPWKSDDDNIGSPKEISVQQRSWILITSLILMQGKVQTPLMLLKMSWRTETVRLQLCPHLLISCLDDISQEAPQLEDKNALDLVITPDRSDTTTNLDLTSQSTNWELALVTNPSSNVVVVSGNSLGGGLDRSTLDSLYNVALAKTNPNETYHVGRITSNPFEDDDYIYTQEQPIYASSNTEPQASVQKNAVAQEEHDFTQQQEQFTIGNDPTNPFGNPFIYQDNLSHPSENQSLNPSLI